MVTLQNITADFMGKHIDLYKKHLRYCPNLQSIVYKRLSYNIIHNYQKEETTMPYYVLNKKLDQLSNLVIDFIKETKKINTVQRVKSTFSPPILKLILLCTFANKGIAVDLCGKIRDEKVIASETRDTADLNTVTDMPTKQLVKDYEEVKRTMFTKNIKYAPILKKSLGKQLKEIITLEDDTTTRFGVDGWITVREEPNRNGPNLLKRDANGLTRGKDENFLFATGEAAIIVVKVTPIEDCRYVSGIEFYKNRRICTPMKIIGKCLCYDRCIKDLVVEGKYDFIDGMGTSNDKQMVSQICHIPEGTGIKNISYKRDNFGFSNIKFHIEEEELNKGNFLLTEARNRLLQDQILNPLYLFEISTFTCEYKGQKIIRDFGGRFYSNRSKLDCKELQKIVEDLKEEEHKE